MQKLEPIDQCAVSDGGITHTVDLMQLAAECDGYIAKSKAANTRRAYLADLKDFDRWCEQHGLVKFPATPEAVSLYVTDLARIAKPATIRRRLTAIAQAHEAAGVSSPTRSTSVKATLAGIRREKGVAQTGKAPLLITDIRAIVEVMANDLPAVRDRALLLLGFAGAFRRSELVGLDIEDLEFRAEGLVVTLHRSKTDQEGQGTQKPIPFGRDARTCPVRAVQAWLEAVQTTSGPVFRAINRHGQVQSGRMSGRAVAMIIKSRAKSAGLDPSRFSGHSLRAGFATQAAMAGASDRLIMAQTGHKSVGMVHRYIRMGTLFQDSAANLIGL